MLLIDESGRIIGSFTRPVTTSVVMVQLGVHRNIVLSHPEAIDNMQQVQILKMERIKIEQTEVLLIRGPIPQDLFQHEGFVQWTGDGS